jgi:hypothetical protein
VDWPAACIALRVVGAVLVFSSGLGVKFTQSHQPMGSKGQYLKKCPKALLTNKKQGNLNTLLTLLANANSHA